MGIPIGLVDERIVVLESGEACVRGQGCRAAAVVEALGRSAPDVVVAELGIEPADAIAALAWRGLGDGETPRLGLVQGRPAERALAGSLAESAWAGVFPGASRPARQALAAGLWQIYDFWDQSHEAAQSADDSGEHMFAPYWHGIAHRREPDPGNAGYWFRRVGRHPVFNALVQAARPLLDRHGDSRLASRFLQNGWDPYAMIDLCTQSAPGQPREILARRLQRLEILLLLEATVRPLLDRPA